MAAKTFDDLMNGFGVVTVMNACIYEKDGGYTNKVDCCKIGGANSAFTPKGWKKTSCTIDTLKIANITQEGPTKTITGGQYSNPLIKYGKTATMEMQDALGRAETLVRLSSMARSLSKKSLTFFIAISVSLRERREE